MKGYLLNKSARRKIRKAETFKEWLLYTRFRGIIPKICLVLYFISEIIHLCAILSCFVLDQLQVPLIGEKILINLVSGNEKKVNMRGCKALKILAF